MEYNKTFECKKDGKLRTATYKKLQINLDKTLTHYFDVDGREVRVIDSHERGIDIVDWDGKRFYTQVDWAGLLNPLVPIVEFEIEDDGF